MCVKRARVRECVCALGALSKTTTIACKVTAKGELKKRKRSFSRLQIAPSRSHRVQSRIVVELSN